MSRDFGKIVQDQEDAGFAACRAAFVKAHPKENPEASEECDAGAWSCDECPWKKTARLHRENMLP